MIVPVNFFSRGPNHIIVEKFVSQKFVTKILQKRRDGGSKKERRE